MTSTAATNSAPSNKYSPASAAITAISDSALLIGCRCASRLTAPPTQTAPKARNKMRWKLIIKYPVASTPIATECAILLGTGYSVLLFTRQPQSPLPPDSQSPEAAETSSQRTSVGHSGSGAMSRAPRYKERGIRKSLCQTKATAAATATAAAQTMAHAIRQKTTAWPRTPP